MKVSSSNAFNQPTLAITKRIETGSLPAMVQSFVNNKNTTIMPKTRTITVYTFSELSEDAKENAIENLSDINVTFDWWESIYEELKSIGFECKGFEIYRYCKLIATESYRTIAKKNPGTAWSVLWHLYTCVSVHRNSSKFELQIR